MIDLLIQNGLVVDGTGRRAYRGDIAVNNGKILRIAPVINLEAGKTIDALEHVVAPGFIDYHSHSDAYFLFGTDGYNMLEQGITTEITGHCGTSVVPSVPGAFDEARGMVPDELLQHVYDVTADFKRFTQAVSNMEMGTNLAFYVGHGSIRARVMGNADAKPGVRQMEEMKALVREAMENGFVGLSTGLIYPPSVYGDTDEIVELAGFAARYGGYYTSHIRGESGTVVEAVREAIEIGERSGCNVIISHHKVNGINNAGKSSITCRLIEEANSRGRVKIYADHYPFLAGHTTLMAVIPPQFLTEGAPAFMEKLMDPAFRSEMTGAIINGQDGGRLLSDSGFAGALVISAPQTPDLVGKHLSEIAETQNRDYYDAMYDIIAENRGHVLMAYFGQNEEDMLNILSKPYVMAGTDGMHNTAHHDREKVGGAHPRLMSTFPRHLRLIREHKLFSLEEAVSKITAMPAEAAGLDQIGILREGYNADITIFDYDNIADTNDFIHPFRGNIGIDYVVVNGKIAVEKGRYNGTKAGKILSKRKT